MAHQINELTDEFKEINREDYKDYFEHSQEEVSRLRSENRKLVLSNEKLFQNLVKKKNKLETERTNSDTLRQLIQELNATRSPPVYPTIPPLQNTILNIPLNEELVDRLMTEKAALENLVYEQKLEIELLNSELMSCKEGLTQQTESQHQEYALNREVTQLRTDLALKEQQLEERKYQSRGSQIPRNYPSLLIGQKPDYKSLLETRNKVKPHPVCHPDQLEEGSYKGGMLLEPDQEMIKPRASTPNPPRSAWLTGVKGPSNPRRERNELTTGRSSSVLGRPQVTDLDSHYLRLDDGDSPQRIAVFDEQLVENIGIVHSKVRLSRTTSTPHFQRNKDEKHFKLSFDQTEPKPFETSLVITGATSSCMAPQIVPMVNKSGVTPFGIAYRQDKMVNVIKLKYLPYPIEYQGEQVICQIKKWYQLGVLVGIFDVRTAMNFKGTIQKYAGIKLYNPVGNSSGEFRGKGYFRCEPNCGIFVPIEDVFIPVV